MMQRKRWRKRSLGVLLGLVLGWVVAGYTPGLLHSAADAPEPREMQSPESRPSPPKATDHSQD